MAHVRVACLFHLRLKYRAHLRHRDLLRFRDISEVHAHFAELALELGRGCPGHICVQPNNEERFSDDFAQNVLQDLEKICYVPAPITMERNGTDRRMAAGQPCNCHAADGCCPRRNELGWCFRESQRDGLCQGGANFRADILGICEFVLAREDLW